MKFNPSAIAAAATAVALVAPVAAVAPAAHAAPVYSDTVVANSPTAYFRLNETGGTSVSSSVGGFTGTSTGTPNLALAGPRPPAFGGLESTNTGAGLAAANDSFSVAGLTGALAGSGGITLELFVNNVATASNVSYVAAFVPVATASGGTTTGANVTVRNGLLRIGGRSSGADGFKAGANVTLTPAELAGYTYIAGVVDYANGTISTYVDGALRDTSAVTFAGATFAPGAPVGQSRIGGVSGAANEAASEFVGGIDEVAFYGRALTAAEVSANYNAAVTAVPEPTSVSLGLLGLAGLMTRRRR